MRCRDFLKIQVRTSGIRTVDMLMKTGSSKRWGKDKKEKSWFVALAIFHEENKSRRIKNKRHFARM